MSNRASFSPIRALTRRLLALLLLASPVWAAGAAYGRQAAWPAAMRLVYEIDAGADAEQTLGVVRERLEVLRPQRTDALLDDAGRLLVRLRSAGDRDLAVAVIGQTGDFRITLVASDDPAEIQAAVDAAQDASLAETATLPEGRLLAATGERFEPYLLIYAPGAPELAGAELTGAHVRLAERGVNSESGASIVRFELDGAGARAMTKLTTDHVRERLAIVFDGQILMAPVISTPITGGEGYIDGNFTTEGAEVLAAILNAGPLPPLTLVEESVEE